MHIIHPMGITNPYQADFVDATFTLTLANLIFFQLKFYNYNIFQVLNIVKHLIGNKVLFFC